MRFLSRTFASAAAAAASSASSSSSSAAAALSLRASRHAVFCASLTTGGVEQGGQGDENDSSQSSARLGAVESVDGESDSGVPHESPEPIDGDVLPSPDADKSGRFFVKVAHAPKLAFREDIDSLISGLIQGPYRLKSVHHTHGPTPSWYVQLDSKIDQQTLVQVGKAFFAGRMVRFSASTAEDFGEDRFRGLRGLDGFEGRTLLIQGFDDRIGLGPFVDMFDSYSLERDAIKFHRDPKRATLLATVKFRSKENAMRALRHCNNSYVRNSKMKLTLLA